MRTLLRKLLTLVLVVSLTPGSMEVLENLEHLVHDGHLAHGMGHNEGEDVALHDALEAEHGCTPISHTCGCHSSVPAILPDHVDPGLPGNVVVSQRLQAQQGHPLHRANAPPVPPPRA